MGGCCFGYEDPKIKSSQNIDDLAKAFKEKKDKFPTEVQQIQEYLKDKSKPIDFFNAEELSEEDLQNRLTYLAKLDKQYNRVIRLLYKNPKLDIEKAKPFLSEISSKYAMTHDPNDELTKEVDNFENFVQESLKQKTPDNEKGNKKN